MEIDLRSNLRPQGDFCSLPDFAHGTVTDQSRRLVCRLCRHPITTDAERTSVDGRHVHLRTNPFGLEFEIGCFRDAPGARAVGEATLEHTWFAGHTWEIVVCRGCGQHLGWFFRSPTSSFFGLIRNRLELEAESGGGAS